MANKKTLTLSGLLKAVELYVGAKEQANPDFEFTFDELTNLVNTIGKIYSIEQIYVDKLPELSGEDLSNGRIIEEYFTDLLMPMEDDGTGTGALSPSDPTYRPAYYSYPLKKVKFKQTLRYDQYQDITHNSGEFVQMSTQVLRRLYDSELLYRYTQKRQLLGNVAKKLGVGDDTESLIMTVVDNLSGTVTADVKGKDKVGKMIGVSGEKKVYNIYKDLTPYKTFNDAITDGAMFENKMVYANTAWKHIGNKNACTAAGFDYNGNLVDFVQAIKLAVEQASDVSEGNSLSGNTLGDQQSLVLYVQQGLKPILETEVLATTFHPDRLSLPVEVKTLKDFGNAGDDIVALLIDPRGVKLHRDYFSAKSQENADGDWITYFLHELHTGFISANTFMRAFTATTDVKTNSKKKLLVVDHAVKK